MKKTTLTPIGFKRYHNRADALRDGYKREYMQCPTCGDMTYRDFIPRSLKNPIIITNCGHSYRTFKPF